jgi:hypothetical protein
MKITDSAVEAILSTMKKKGLDPKKTFLEVGIFDGNLGIGFTREGFGRKIKNNDLTVVVTNNIDSANIVIDYNEINGRKGLIFSSE